MNDAPAGEALQASGFTLDQARGAIEQVVTQESLALAVNHIFLLSALVFVGAAMIIWLSPRPQRPIEAGTAH